MPSPQVRGRSSSLDGGTEEGVRANFARGPDGTVQWFRFGGRISAAARLTPPVADGGPPP
ncbi:hypothetical protein [Micromonospora sp. KC723]|uniref:hypothetical protein n=1 Tax=Micromonospora sp. KC723 TaxID=2530381 RepID=UPI00104DDA5C|nr:hypothetical protein [Micromonospora sp. KC723]TDB70665.1 hypothetical protein E1165_25025 [Micromonospora sp. KC723]